MPKICMPCKKCGAMTTEAFEGPITIKGGKFPELICNPCREMLGMFKSINISSLSTSFSGVVRTHYFNRMRRNPNGVFR